MEATAYCSCVKCCGKNPGDPGYGITASGEKVRPGIVAADWKMLPQGTRILIEGHGEAVVEDAGGGIKGNRIDIFVDKHQVALEFGRKMARVRILRGGKQ